MKMFKQTKINTDNKLIYADITYKIRGAIFAVYNSLGFGHKEQIYQKALETEFKDMNIPFTREQNLDVNYKGAKVGNYRPDFVVDEKVIIELKAVEFMPKTYEQQLLHYLKTTGFSLGLLVNFGASRLDIRRLVWTNPRKSAINPLKSLLIAVITLGLFLTLGTTSVHAAAVSWDGGASTTAWNDALNWSNDAVPTSADTVTIDNAAVVATTTAINFSTLTIGSGTNTTSLTLTTNIGTGGSITINNAGTLTQNNATTQTITGTLTINSGGNITHTANTTTNAFNVKFTAATITLNSGGNIDVSGKGYSEGQGPGAGCGGGNGHGGSHGGEGGKGSSCTNEGVTNDSVTNPTDLGSGGSQYSGLAKGGGAVILNVSGTLTVNGTINTDGVYREGSGAGGTVNITTGTFAGTGSITSKGGYNTGTFGGSGAGGGGGGRIAIKYNTDSSNLTTLAAYGGYGPYESGGPGTIYKATQAGANRTLIIDNNDVASQNGSELEDYSITLDTIQLQNSGVLNIKSGSSMTISANQINNSVGDATGILSNEGTLTFPSSYTLNGYILWANATGTVSGLTDLTIGSTGTISHGYNKSTKVNYINLSLSSLTINSGGKIDVTNKGYSSSNGPGGGCYGGDGSGGSHGGWGGKPSSCSTLKGPNDSISNPNDLGSGGGSGTSGGGLITLTISGTLTNNGSIIADGADTTGNVGAGAGGTVNLTAGTLTGSGSITAKGGNHNSGGQSGGGGGGRIALSITTNSYTGSTSVIGGAGCNCALGWNGTAGTVYFGSPNFDNISSTATKNISNTSLLAENGKFGRGAVIDEGFGADSSYLYKYETANNLKNSIGTLSLWWKPGRAYNAYTGDVYIFTADNTNKGFRLIYDYDDYVFRWQIGNGTDWTTVAVTSAAQTFSSGSFIHLAATYDNTSGSTFYVNGVPSGTAYSGSWTAQTLPTYFYIGSDANGYGRGNATIDDLALWDSVYTASQIKALYNAGGELADEGSTSIGFWDRVGRLIGSSLEFVANSGNMVFKLADAAGTYFFKVQDSSGTELASIDSLGQMSLTSSGTTGTSFGVTANSVTTGTGISGTFNGLTTGTGLSISSSGTIASGGELVNLTASGATTGDVLAITSNSLTTGNGIVGTFNGLTSGNALDLSSSSTALTGSLVDLTLSGSSASNTGPLVTLTNSGTLNANTSLYIKHYATGTNNLAFRVDDVSGDTSPFVIDGTGQVGIGTTAPGAKLEALSTGEQLRLTYDSTRYTSFTESSTGILNIVPTHASIGLGAVSTSCGSLSTQLRLCGATSSSNTTGLTTGVSIESRFTTSATTSQTGLYIGTVQDNAGVATTLANYYGIHLVAPTVGSNWTITNRYGIYQEDSSSKNYFAGNVGIGTTSPAQALDVVGDINSSTKYRIGNNILLSVPGTGNTILGTASAGNIANITGTYNTVVGNGAGTGITSGGSNTLLGHAAGGSITTGTQNTFLGLYAGNNNTGSGSTVVGYYAAGNGSSANNLTAIGYQALYSNTTGTLNVATGYQSLFSNTTGLANSAFGYQALNLNTTGGNNTASGYQALLSNTTGSTNTAFGSAALSANTTASNNSAFGYTALTANTTGTDNSAFGYQALLSNTTGNANSAFGYAALSSSTTGTNNVALGYGAGSTNTTGSSNIFLGYQAGSSYQTTSSNQFIAGSSNHAINNIYFGKGALDAAPTAYTINGTGGSGTDIAGGALQLAGGKATGNASGGSIIFQTSDAGATGTTLQSLTTKMTITAGGNVGIGTTAPSQKLQIVGGNVLIPFDNYYYMGDTNHKIYSTVGVGMTIDDYDSFFLKIGGTERFRQSGNFTRFTLNESGTNPAFAINNTGTKDELLQLERSGTSKLVLGHSNSSGYAFIQGGTSTNLILQPTSGNVGIGTTAPASHLNLVTAASTPGLLITGTAASAASSGNGTAASSILSVTGAVGQAASATTGVTAGAGGALSLTGGLGGGATGASGANIGGAGGAISLITGVGGDATSGTGGAGGNLTLTASNGGSGTTPGAGGAVTITAGTAVGAGVGNGGAITITAGTATGSGSNGGALSLAAGNGGNGGTGGAVTITSGTGSTTGNGLPSGTITIGSGTTPNGSDSASGAMIFQSGLPGNSTSGNGGASGTVTIRSQAGASSNTGNGGASGALTLSTGNGGSVLTSTGTAGAAGALSITGGNGGGTNAVTGGAGSTISITAGNGGVGTSTGGAAGALTLTAGNGALATAGGNISLTGGTGGATNAAGGSLYLIGGAAGGSGTAGNVLLGITSGGTARGNVGIGTTAPSAALEVKASGTGVIAKFTSTNTTGCTLADGGTISCTSDRNFKKNIGELNYGLDTLMQLNPVEFNWNSQTDGSLKSLGFIAQEVEAIVPNLVTTDSSSGFKQLNTIGLVPVLAKAIQEQQEQINELKAVYKTDEQGYLVMPKIKAEKIIVNDELRIMNDGVTLSAGPYDSSKGEGDNTVPSPLWGEGQGEGVNYIDVASRVQSSEFRIQNLEEKDSTSSAKLAVLGENVASQSARIDELKRQLEALLGLDSGNASTSSASIYSLSEELATSRSVSISDDLNLTPPDILLATGSATLAKIDITEKASILNLEAFDATISASFKSLGDTFLGRTTVAGDFSIDGTLSITGNSLNSISCMASTTLSQDSSLSGAQRSRSVTDNCGILYIQSSPLASLVDIFNGLVTIDNTGKLAVHKLAISSDTLGTVTIKAGQKSVEVITTQLTRNSKVFTTSSKPAILGVQKDTNHTKFIISLDKPSLEDITIDWWIVDQR